MRKWFYTFYCLQHWNILLYLIFHFKVNGAVNDSEFPAVGGGCSAASTLESPRGPLWSTAVNGSYLHLVTVLCSSHRAAAGRRAVLTYWPYATEVHHQPHPHTKDDVLLCQWKHCLLAGWLFHISVSYPEPLLGVCVFAYLFVVVGCTVARH